MNHIELFAGCGGLNLGLASRGFSLLLANELSPMAAESFAFNFLNEDFQRLALSKQMPKSVHWINSRFSDLKNRLRENPYQFPAFDDSSYSPYDFSEYEKLKGGLIVGSVVELNRALSKNHSFQKALRTGFGDGGVDLVSGGPPCQSFSMAGLRKMDCEKNTLPMEFAEFVSYAQPRIALLENVTGILHAFTDDAGNKFHAWFEVAKVFATKGYVPLCLHVNAKYVGVPQNRPRFIMISIRNDCFEPLLKTFAEDSLESEMLNKSKEFFDIVQTEGESTKFGTLNCYDVLKHPDRKFFEGTIFSRLFQQNIVSVQNAIDDLKKTSASEPSSFVKNLNKTFSTVLRRNTNIPISNHELRSNSPLVKRRFRIYQIIGLLKDKDVQKEVGKMLKGKIDTLPTFVWESLKDVKFLMDNDQLEHFSDKAELEMYLLAHKTKKLTQKALTAEQPAPAALSIPDDACHYDEGEIRVLTVREMARIQSFPDAFEFRSKVTTGGTSRGFEVPQYTQVGNAVPPLLGVALGDVCSEILKRMS